LRIVVDIETDKLYDPTQIWVICCKDIDTGIFYIFREVTKSEEEKKRFLTFAQGIDLWIGHNIIEFDYPVLRRLLDLSVPDIANRSVDTLIVSRLVNYTREYGHSLESWGIELGLDKVWFKDFSAYSKEMEEYCVRDVDVCHKVYLRFMDTISDPAWRPSISLEQQFQLILNSVHDRGFAFNSTDAMVLLDQVKGELNALDREIQEAFPDRLRLVKEVHPKLTRYGTLHRGDFRWVKGGDLTEFNGGPFSRCKWVPFNPASHKQVIEVLVDAAWAPVEKTDTHIQTLREINKLKRSKDPKKVLDLEKLSAKLISLEKYGFKVNENNLSTLPPSAPPPALLLHRRILRESRRRTLTEWLSLLSPDGRVHAEFAGIGAWTGRMAHQKPNLANIPNEFVNSTGAVKYLGKELRSLWTHTPGRILWGVDADSIQFRVAAHYINDKNLTERIVNGRKADKTDTHSFNQRLLGKACKSRQAAKQFLYSAFLGAGIGKLSEILDSTEREAEKALAVLLREYPGIDYVKREVATSDAKQGYFIGLDGRRVPIPGDTVSERKHLAPSGYLQCGEAIIIKLAATHFEPRLKDLDSFLVDIVHDEYQGESPNKEIALEACQIVSDSIAWAGEELKLHCPMKGSFYDEDHQRYTIGSCWYTTH
jgi:DNA polymerase I